MSRPESPRGGRPRIAVLAYSEYGSDPRVRREAEALAEAGYAVHVISLRPRLGETGAHAGAVHLHEVPLSLRRGSKLRYLFQYILFVFLAAARLVALDARRPVRVVHVHSLPDFLVLAALPLKLRRAAVLLDLHEVMPEIFAARHRVSTRSMWFRAAVALERLSGLLADHVIAANDGIRDRIVSRGLPELKVTTVYNAIQEITEPGSLEGLQAQFSLPDAPLVVHAGGINPERDLETLLKALARLPSDARAHLVIAGEGDAAYESALIRLANSLGVSDRVQFLGKLSPENARALMSLSSVGLVTLEDNPLTEVAWPTRVTEFAHLDKPLIVPRLRFLGEVLGDAARYYTPGDPDSLAQELLGALRFPHERVSAVARAREICRRMTWPYMRGQLVGVLRLLEGHHAS